MICDIETGFAKVAKQIHARLLILPIQPKENEMVLTIFWADNFDKIVENETDGGSVHTTHIVAFKKQTKKTSLEYIHVAVPKTKSRKINFNEVIVVVRLAHAKEEPRKQSFTYDTKTYTTKHFLWVILRKRNAFDQLIPIYSGWK